MTGAQHAEAARAGSVSGGNWLRATLRRSVSSFRGASNPQELEARAGSFTGGGGVGGLNKRTVSWTSRARQPPEEAVGDPIGEWQPHGSARAVRLVLRA